MEWLPKQKIYLGKYYIITEDEFELLNNFKHDYKRPSPTELLEIFPEAGPIIKKNYRILKNKQEIMEGISAKHFSRALKIFYSSFSELPKEIENLMYNYIYQIFRRRPFLKIEAQIKHLNQLLKIIEWKKKPKNIAGQITDYDIARAKQIPLTNFMTFNRAGFTHCPFHNEKTASFKYYPEENRFHCFSCQESGDVIDYIIKITKLDFIQAVKKLLNK